MSIEAIMLGERMKFIKRIKAVNNEIKTLHFALKSISDTSAQIRLLSELESLIDELRYLTVNKDSEFIDYLDLQIEKKLAKHCQFTAIDSWRDSVLPEDQHFKPKY